MNPMMMGMPPQGMPQGGPGGAENPQMLAMLLQNPQLMEQLRGNPAIGQGIPQGGGVQGVPQAPPPGFHTLRPQGMPPY